MQPKWDYLVIYIYWEKHLFIYLLGKMPVGESKTGMGGAWEVPQTFVQM